MTLVLLAGAGGAVGVALLSLAGMHFIPEGHVGVYWRNGALTDRVTLPGVHMMKPFLTSVAAVQVTMQTDKVKDIPCGTSGGTVIYFDKIEVVNQLATSAVLSIVKNYTTDYDKVWIFDKIHHEINQFCSQHTLQEVFIDLFDTLDETLKETLQRDIDQWAPGLRIISIRVTKPRVPRGIQQNYEQIESEKTRLKVAEQTQKLVEKEAETERKRAVIEAEKLAMVAAIELNRTKMKMEFQRSEELAQKMNEQRISEVQNDIATARVKAEADADYYRSQKEAEANRLRLTPELIALETARALANNTKVYFGEKIPSLFVDNTLLTSPPNAAQQLRE